MKTYVDIDNLNPEHNFKEAKGSFKEYTFTTGSCFGVVTGKEPKDKWDIENYKLPEFRNKP